MLQILSTSNETSTGPELVQNGNFTGVTELVVGGDFPLPNADWITAASTTINGGSATFEGLGIASAYTGILNTYSGASVGYSLRLLDNTYTGFAIRVRRASDNAEQNIGFVSNVLDTASLETFCASTDGFVTTWYDQSGNTNDVVQSSASSQPQIVSGGVTLTENGKPSIDFDGSNDYLEETVSITQPYTLFDVRKYNDLTSQIAISFDNVGTSIGDGVLGAAFRSYYGSYLIGESVNVNQGLWYSLGNGGSSAISLNNGAETTGSLGSSGVSSITIGRLGTGSLVSDVKLQELILYPSDASANKSGVSTNINDFYSIY
jgi:hypothetical protein